MVWVFVRQLVSMQRKRTVAEGYHLRPAYISERLVAMSYPADSGLEVVYRNPIWQVQRFLDLRHQDCYKVGPGCATVSMVCRGSYHHECYKVCQGCTATPSGRCSASSAPPPPGTATRYGVGVPL